MYLDIYVCMCVYVCMYACRMSVAMCRCMYTYVHIMSVAQLVRECIWRMETLETFGSEVRVRYEHRRNPPKQGTHMQLPLSMDRFCQNN